MIGYRHRGGGFDVEVYLDGSQPGDASSLWPGQPLWASVLVSADLVHRPRIQRLLGFTLLSFKARSLACMAWNLEGARRGLGSAAPISAVISGPSTGCTGRGSSVFVVGPRGLLVSFGFRRKSPLTAFIGPVSVVKSWMEGPLPFNCALWHGLRPCIHQRGRHQRVLGISLSASELNVGRLRI